MWEMGVGDGWMCVMIGGWVCSGFVTKGKRGWWMVVDREGFQQKRQMRIWALTKF